MPKQDIPDQEGLPSETEPPGDFWFEETQRGGAELLLVMRGGQPRGSIECLSYEEKLAWMSSLSLVNTTLKMSEGK